MRSVVVWAAEGPIVVNGRSIDGASLIARRLVTSIGERGAAGLEVSADVSGADVAVLLELLSDRGGPQTHVAANDVLAARSVSTIRLLPPHVKGRGEGADGGGAGDREGTRTRESGDFPELLQDVVDLLQRAAMCACQGCDLDLNLVHATVKSLVDGLGRDAGGLYRLAHYTQYDFLTFGHSIRVGLLAIDVARPMTDDGALLVRLGTAALLHDVGMVLVPWEVIHKRGTLDADERREMERHPVHGARILLATKNSDPLSVVAAYGHHRCADGGGYPQSIGEMHQGMVAKLVKVCDVFEALTAVRPWRPPITPARAFRVMLDSMKGHFDRAMLEHFIRMVGIYPAGTEVQLDDGSTARVIRQTGDFHRPVVDRPTDAEGAPFATGTPRTYDLTHPEAGGPTMVVGVTSAPEPEATHGGE